MENLNLHPYRMLIVEDEARDWAIPMETRLKIAAKLANLNNLVINVATSIEEAESFMARYYYHFSSFDVRLPKHTAGALSSEHGVALACAFPEIGFPKRIVYSHTLRTNAIRDETVVAASVLPLPVDYYAKPTGSDDDETSVVKVLKLEDWATLVVNSLTYDSRHIEGATSGCGNTPVESVIGAYLRHGVSLLPPFLAKKLQELAVAWDNSQTIPERNNAAVAFIEGTARLALIQSAILLECDTKDTMIPVDYSWGSCMNKLKEYQAKLHKWNWSNYLTKQAIDAIDCGRDVRNDHSHDLKQFDYKQRWGNLRTPLQYAMDIAAYWVRHPLIFDLQSRQKCLSGELLAGQSYPRARSPLSPALKFPDTAQDDGVWQSVWHIGSNGEAPTARAVSWTGWLKQASNSDNQWWFPRYVRGNKRNYLSLIDGSSKMD